MYYSTESVFATQLESRRRKPENTYYIKNNVKVLISFRRITYHIRLELSHH